MYGNSYYYAHNIILFILGRHFSWGKSYLHNTRRKEGRKEGRKESG
jgi:hypothetical protein